MSHKKKILIASVCIISLGIAFVINEGKKTINRFAFFTRPPFG